MKVEDCHMENPVDENHIYQKDCFAVGLSFVRGHATTIGSISMGIACIMVSNIKSTNLSPKAKSNSHIHK